MSDQFSLEFHRSGPVRRKAHLLCVGINEYGSPAWDLQYAENDALSVARELGTRLAGYEVVPTVLITDDRRNTATKDGIRAALEQLVRDATPDDLVLVFFSGHGYNAAGGEFYLLPGGSRPWKESNWERPSRVALDRCISANELSTWLRDVDAGELVLIIDACHAAGAVDRPGFKPGPLGDRGFGQLAYDKRMRILAASQSDQAAREMGGQIGHGVLTYALVHDALLTDPKQTGADANADGTLTLKEWLEYPTRRVPLLFEEIREERLNTFGVPAAKSAVSAADVGASLKEDATQVPQLFDFAKWKRLEVRLATPN